MSVVWKIAFRNLKEHKVKTLIIGILIAIGVTVLVVGNSLMDSATKGIRKTYIENYTGHLIITAAYNGRLTLFGPQGMDSDGVIPRLPNSPKIEKFLASHPDVAAYCPQISTQATISFDDELQGFTLLFGIQPSAYRAMFPDNIELLEGQYFRDSQEGLLLSETIARRLERTSGREIEPGDRILLSGLSMTGGIKVREVEVRGIFRFRHSNPQLNMVSLLDATNARALSGLTGASAGEVQLDEEEKELLGEVDEESLFEEGLFTSSPVTEDTQQAEDPLAGLLGPVEVSESEGAAAEETGPAGFEPRTWHFLLVKLKDPSNLPKVRLQLQRFFADEGIDAQTVDWVTAAGVTAQMASGVKVAFNVVVLIIAVVAVIIIMNTLVISVTERIPEIGTMRAIGTQKSFIRKLITCETVLLSLSFGLLGIIVGSLILAVLHLTGIEAPNMFFEVLFGGKVLRPTLSAGAVLLSLLVVTLVGLVSSLYPTSIALRISPVRAMQNS